MESTSEPARPEVRDLAHDLAIMMVEIDAHIVRFRRAVPAGHMLDAPLRDLDESFARPIALARHVVLAAGGVPVRAPEEGDDRDSQPDSHMRRR
jgi:hypothetical protein